MSIRAIYLDAVLEPPRSLSPKGLSRVMLVLGVCVSVFSIGFVMAGAFPIVGFMGAEVLLLWYLLDRATRRSGPRTHVRITADNVEVCRISVDGREVGRDSLPAYFARVVHDVRARGGHALRIVAGKRSFAIGEHLSDDEKSSLARRIERALSDARRERYPTEQNP